MDELYRLFFECVTDGILLDNSAITIWGDGSITMVIDAPDGTFGMHDFERASEAEAWLRTLYGEAHIAAR